jgi:hypothetical protein
MGETLLLRNVMICPYMEVDVKLIVRHIADRHIADEVSHAKCKKRWHPELAAKTGHRTRAVSVQHYRERGQTLQGKRGKGQTPLNYFKCMESLGS